MDRNTPIQPLSQRDGGKIRKAYVRQAELSEILARCNARREQKQEYQASMHLWREMRETVREAEDQCKPHQL